MLIFYEGRFFSRFWLVTTTLISKLWFVNQPKNKSFDFDRKFNPESELDLNHSLFVHLSIWRGSSTQDAHKDWIRSTKFWDFSKEQKTHKIPKISDNFRDFTLTFLVGKNYLEFCQTSHIHRTDEHKRFFATIE